jgi:ABC-type cobalt transport system, permease component CbiQ and related transporters
MSRSFITYVKEDSWIHRLKGSTKLICFLLLSLAAMISYDTRLLVAVVCVSVFSFKSSKVPLKRIRFLLSFMVILLLSNFILVYIFSPEEGVKIYESRTVLWEGYGRFTITAEQLFYMFNVMVKYLAIIPMALIFILTTYPSEFASSLNRVGVSYRIAYSVSIALRYIPTFQEDFTTIFQAQQARGVDMSKKQSMFKKIRNVTYTMFPLIFSSLQKIDIITNAMLLRGFGQYEKRTWYHDAPTNKIDIIAMSISFLFVVMAFILFYVNKGRFYSPF